jgi:molybdate transport system substrate-binding protein
VALGNVDAVVGWRVFQYWAPEEVETVYLEPEQVPRIGYVPIAVSTFSKQPALAERFIDFIVSEEAQDIYRDWSYLTTVEEAREFAPEADIGAEWELPEGWR